MNYEVKLGDKFKQAFKRLRKKYKSLDNDLEKLITVLEHTPALGADLGHGVRKVRLAISSKGKGKSHGARVITHTAIISVENGVVTLLATKQNKAPSRKKKSKHYCRNSGSGISLPPLTLPEGRNLSEISFHCKQELLNKYLFK